MSDYDNKRGARAQRYLNKAAKARKESDAAYNASNQAVAGIPLGQPILVGHHSERRHRRALEKSHNQMRKSIELDDKAKEYERRASAALNNTAIFSDDPNATEKLAEKIERLEKRQAIMKQANALVRKNDTEGLLNLGFSETEVQKLIDGDFMGRTGFASYLLTNNNANIRRLKLRLEQLEKQAKTETTEIQIENVRIVDNTEENRTQIFFPGKPIEECRKELKSHGFRWSPTFEAWQRHLSNDAHYWAVKIVEKFYSKKQ